ncbi:MAG: peptidoglycan-binding protein [Clostridia bacterium]|nr:peptidoglycan-binding protein [Bacilli bacterium]MBR3672835.1 peptidoglycan-binding protein [Clostridia bacterium]
MKKFYLGMETIRITQNYDGKTSHYNHSHGTPADYPIDMAGADGGQSCYFAPVDMKITAIKGVGSSTTNTVWLVSTEEVKTPTFIDKVFMSLTHWNDNAMKWKVGDIVKAGEVITWEGTDGASGNHLHVCFGRGYSDNWVKNSKGSWVDTGDNKKPQEVAYIYDKFSKTVDTCGINFEHTDNIDYDNFLPPRGYYQKGDSGENVEKIDDFYMTKVRGNYFGEYTYWCVKAFQHINHLEEDGNIGAITLGKMKEQGLNKNVRLPERGWFTKGDSSDDVAIIDNFLCEKVKGNYYGDYTENCTKALQTIGKQDGVYDDAIDGCFGAKTLKTAEYYGFHY